jgi:choline dehydrogenase
VKSAKAVGHEYVDVNSDKQLGVSYVQQNSKNGKRITAARAYLEPVSNRRNLHILQFSRATNIVIDKGFTIYIILVYS